MENFSAPRTLSLCVMAADVKVARNQLLFVEAT
jgi:hypothetical protein